MQVTEIKQNIWKLFLLVMSLMAVAIIVTSQQQTLTILPKHNILKSNRLSQTLISLLQAMVPFSINKTIKTNPPNNKPYVHSCWSSKQLN